MNDLLTNTDYKNWIIELKSKIRQSQIKAALAVNSQLILMYWELGQQITEKQKNSLWGSSFIDQLSKDLKSEFPEMSGFSVKNLRYCRNFYLFYSDISIRQQAVAKLQNTDKQCVLSKITLIPWGHNLLILQKVKNPEEVLFYISQTIENNWSRSVLEYQIESGLFSRQGKAISNFKTTLPKIESDLAQALLKDPYNFEFLALSDNAREHELEQRLVQHISQFLLELGKGFAYMGRQFSVKIGRKEYRTDLLFYHTKLKAYIVIELKLKEFEPEFIGKLNFYISAINEVVKESNDNPTIGILLCKNKDDFEVDFSLRDINKPIGVSEFTYKQLPDNIREALPTLEEFESQLKKIEIE